MSPIPNDPRLQTIFNVHDVDSSGSINASELHQALNSLDVAISPADCKTILTDHDSDSSGSLSFQEFKVIFGEARLKAVFQQIDVDSSGSINTAELQTALLSLGYKLSSSQIASIMKKVDSDNSGDVNYTEFHTFFKMVPAASLASIAKQWVSQVPIDVGSDLSPPTISPDVPWYFAIFGGLGGIMSRTATAPLEKVKLVSQVSAKRINIISELAKTKKQLGYKGMFAGNMANCCRVFPYAGIVTIVYLRGLKMTPADNEFDAWEPVYRGSVAASAGIIGQLCTYPMDVVRARLTVNPQLYTSMLHCGKEIFKESGYRGLYKGLTPTLCAVAPFLATQMATADMLKAKAAENNVEITSVRMAVIGGVAGATAQTLVYPLDVLRRRMQVQTAAGSENVLSDNTWLAMRQVVKREGVRSLFSGILVTFAKVIPATAVGMTITRELIQQSNRNRWDN